MNSEIYNYTDGFNFRIRNSFMDFGGTLDHVTLIEKEVTSLNSKRKQKQPVYVRGMNLIYASTKKDCQKYL